MKRIDSGLSGQGFTPLRSIATILLTVTLGGCCTGKAASPGPATGPAGKQAGAQINTATPTRVVVRYFGTISHLLLGSLNHAVLLKPGHKPQMRVFMSDISEANLKTIWTGSNEVQCVAGMCMVPLDNTALQFLSKGALITSRSFRAEKSFDRFVPHVPRVAAVDAAMASIRSDALVNDAPKAGNQVISAWVDLPGGTYSAIPYEWTAIFDPDLERVGERRFGREILLDSTIDTPSLQVDRGAGWKALPFETGGGAIEISITNAPMTDMTDLPTTGMVVNHFDLHFNLINPAVGGSRPVVELRNKEVPPALDLGAWNRLSAFRLDPTTDQSVRRDLNQASAFILAEVPGCSNSQWP